MVIAVIGENCSGKSTLANAIKNAIGAQIITGKDYLRMAKSEGEAERVFKARLSAAVYGENIVYVVSEMAHIKLLPDGAVKILVKADIETIKSRFKMRMRGSLPAPVEQMLIRNHGMFDDGEYYFIFDGVSGDCSELVAFIKSKIL